MIQAGFFGTNKKIVKKMKKSALEEQAAVIKSVSPSAGESVQLVLLELHVTEAS